MSFLTPRLFSIASLVSENDIVADIGTDHGYIPIFLAKDKKAKKIYASDISKKPLSVATNNVTSFGVADKIDLIQSEGLNWINEMQVKINLCIISGMGSTTILEILKKDSNLIDNYVISSNTDVDPIRLWAKKHNYKIESELLVEDNKIIYEILKINKFAGIKIKNKKDVLFGPILRRNPNDLFIQKWLSKENKLKIIVNKKSKNDMNYKIFKRKLKLIGKYINKEMDKVDANKK